MLQAMGKCFEELSVPQHLPLYIIGVISTSSACIFRLKNRVYLLASSTETVEATAYSISGDDLPPGMSPSIKLDVGLFEVELPSRGV